MQRLFVLIAALCMGVSCAVADQLTLRDGRIFTGVVKVRQNTVEIEVDYGRLEFSKSRVLRIDFRETPESQLERKVEQVGDKGPNAMYAVAMWAQAHGLEDRSRAILADILEKYPDHAATRQELGHLQIDGFWCDFDEACQRMRSKLAAGETRKIIEGLGPRMLKLAESDAQKREVREIQAESLLREGHFQQSRRIYEQLADSLPGSSAVRYQAIVEILEQNGDGMYVVSEPYPADANLLATSRPAMKAGPASLKHPLVMEAALRDRAKAELEIGRELLQEAKETESRDPETAEIRYVHAAKAFDRADALVEGIARSYRIEMARRRIMTIRKEADETARRFDRAIDKLGREKLSAEQYRRMVVQLINELKGLETKLQSIQSLARPYPHDLVLEIQWARTDLERVGTMRDILAAELDEIR